MAIDDIKFNLHDSIIVDISFDERGRLEAVVQLYEIFYVEKPTVKLILSGIFNSSNVRDLVSDINAAREDGWLGYRINRFQYDSKEACSTGNLHFYLDIDHFWPVTIHCKKINFLEVARNT
ncbi:hypothetical protein CWC22_011190 [Pseudoalteromonas rubra]|uniref:Uncharacterized protein n=1 Tax=Pseudoalteromonas rubra TaxID=43658 RepID=A0A5S3V3S0_9GAMM|nr:MULTISPECIES: hypothetical protein [Pseudoalteromonas]QPB83522.1 hypothetical protein CWC22_011190 [Pseudoalteromonas rubra]